MSAFAGGGAGLVQLPLIVLLGLPFGEALATHKMATFALGLGSIARNFKDERIDWKFSSYLMLCGISGVVAGSYVILQVPEMVAQYTLAALTIGLGLYSAFNRDLGQHHTPRNRDVAGHVIGGLVLFLLGVFNGTLSSGSGLFVTVWLIVWFGLDYKLAVIYTMTLVGLFWNLAGGVALLAFGSAPEWSWMPVLWVASFAGGWLGAHLGHLKGNVWIKRGFVFVTILSGLSLLLKGIFG